MRKQPQAAASSLPVGSVRAPRLGRVKNGRLYPADYGRRRVHGWVNDARGLPPLTRVNQRAPLNLLDRFIKIAVEPDRQIDEDARIERACRSFAATWGLLQLCRHGLPVGHNEECRKAIDNIEDYRRFALALDALRRLGGEISSKRPGDDTDWELATSILYGPDLQRSAMEETLRRGFRKMSLGVARSEFQALMYRLIIVCRVQPRFNWNGSAWAIDFDSIGGSNLPAILAVQLMAQLGGKALRKCRTCPNWFQPNGRQVYCGKCGIQAAWRSAWQASEQRKREAKTLSISLPARVEKGRKNEV